MPILPVRTRIIPLAPDTDGVFPMPPQQHTIVPDADGILIDDHYHIEWGRIDTPEKILGWVRHLSEKMWMTGPVISAVIDHATFKFGIEIEWPH